MLNGIVHLPLILPPVVTGYLLLLAFGRKGPIGAFLDQMFGIVLAFRWTGAALAAGIMGFPLAGAGYPAFDRSWSTSAWRLPPTTLGASPVWVFFTVTLPLALPGVIAGVNPVLRQGTG